MLDAAKIDELAKLTPEELVKALGPDLDTYVRMLKKIEAAARSRDSLLTFMRYIMPDPNDVEDSDKSRYEVHRLHEVLGEALEKVQKGEILRLAISMPPQMGKQCSHDTPVLTTEGWKLHGDLRVGDRVFGSDGNPTEVIAVSDESLGDMEVEFADGERIHCHARHEWAVFDRALGGAPLRVLETQEIMESGVRIGAAQGRGGRARFSVDWIPLRGEFKNLPVDPYTLGAWLGDGSVGKAAITHHCDDSGVVERIGKLYRKSAAWTHKDTGAVTTSFSGEESGLSTALKKSGVYYSKGIPDAYLTASVEQRMALLAGLMDTDGCIHRPSRRASYVSANARLADDVAVLVRSLGMRATVVADEPRISSSGIVGKQVIYTVSFSPSIPIPCELPRKRISGFKVQYRRRGIVAVRRVAPKLGRCIQVAADDGIYLVGRGLVPTHNSAICTRGFPAWYMGKTPWRNVIVGTYNQTFAGDFGEDVRAIMIGQRYEDVFKTRLRTGSKSKEQLVTEEGGKISFIGRDGSGTGKSADLFIIDDPYKNKADADSLATRDEVWGFFTRVMNTRMLNTGAVIIIHCMTGDTPVMLADGSEKPLRNIKVGDEVATFNDGRLEVATVKNMASQGVDSIYAIRTASGRTVRANARHPFLIWEGGQWKWIKTSDLRPGHEMCRVNGESGKAKPARKRGATSPWCVVDIADRTTAKRGGLMESALRRMSRRTRAASDTSSIGTASLLRSTTAWLRSKAICALFAESRLATTCGPIGAGSCASTIATKPARFEPFSATTATFSSATQRLLKWLLRRPNTSDFMRDRIVEIAPAGVEEVFDIQVDDTENFIANGLVSHNTRWHEDDLIGRLTDPTNPHYNADVAKHWTYINIPEIMDDERIASILGKKVGDALWPERRSLEMLKVARLMDPVGFSALHMGQPTPPEGAFYQIEHLKGYEHKQLPKNMRYYLSGDLAVSTKYGADKTAIGIWGVDESPEPSLWLMPTLYWKKAGADEWVDWMLDQCGSYGILTAYMEKGQIDTAIGPFLERRMMERARAGKGNFVHIEKFPVVGDKGKRSQSFRTLCAMGRVRFPTFAPWWPAAKEQMLKFTGTGNDKEDDFCDMCGIMGQGSAQLISAGVKKENNVIEPKVGTLAWTRWAADREKARAVPGRIKRAW